MNCCSKTFSFLVFSFLLVSGTGCNKNSGPGDYPVYERGISESKGSFFSDGETDDLAARGALSSYCFATGKLWSFDSRLKKGQTFKTFYGRRQEDGSLSEHRTTMNLLELDPEKGFVKVRTYLNEPRLVTGFQPALSNYWYEESCTYSTDSPYEDRNCEELHLSPNLKANLSSFGKSRSSSGRYCWSSYSEPDYEREMITESGTFRFQDGRQVKAFRLIEKTSGVLKCQEYSYNDEDRTAQPVQTLKGTTYRVTISSLKMPPINYPVTCGEPTTLYTYQRSAKASGEILEESTYEILGGKF